MRQKFLILALLVAAAPAWAEDRPLIRPSRDVTVEYRTSGMAQGPAAVLGRMVTMRFTRETGRIRIDVPNGRGFAILDIDTGRIMVVVPERRIYIEQPADKGIAAIFQARNAAFRKTGTDTVAGVSCTTYDTSIGDRKGQVCLTDDGVLLRAQSEDPDRHGELEAVKVTYADQSAAMFETPAGFEKLDPAAIMHGIDPRLFGGRGSNTGDQPER